MSGSLTIGPDRHGRTVAIAEGRIAGRPSPGAPALACPDGEIAAGHVCAHTHLYSGLAPYGMPPADPAPEGFLEILERVWWRLDRALDAEALRAAARDYVAHALLAGTTALVDHHESPRFIEGPMAILAEACEDLGMRALLCYGATERNGGRDEARRGLAECGRIAATPLIRGLVGLHASFTVSDETIREAGNLARWLGTVLHIHVAEARSDVEDARSRGFDGPLERLMALDALVPGSILAHGVHLSPDQVKAAEAASCWLVQNPRSNEGNGVGYASSLASSRHVALGTDGWNADMEEEERVLFRLAERHGDTGATGRLAAGQTLIAERFGFTASGLQPGAPGDVVVREDGRVRQVVIDGHVVVRDGKLARDDIGAIEAEARQQATRLWDRMAVL
ncbi:amidohydrolase family protein [Shumkonia mesophila]|uniref:amidohydrolase family protein n=1 Tax=Shumkonia mesophila TaxID=2838854 RepID=UPI002934A2DB|nr:amidohydrolase family protein [Shumkonia mesophila]